MRYAVDIAKSWSCLKLNLLLFGVIIYAFEPESNAAAIPEAVTYVPVVSIPGSYLTKCAVDTISLLIRLVF